MKCTRDNILVAEMKGKVKKETTTEAGIILSADVDDTKPAGAPALVITVGPDVEGIVPNDVVFVDWSKGLTYHGELQLLAHACVKTVMQTNEGSEKIWNYLDRLEKDYACAQWQGIIKKKIYFKNSENL